MKPAQFFAGMFALVILAASPLSVFAQVPDIDSIISSGLPGVQAAISGSSILDNIPKVPVSVPKLEAKDTGISLFGYSLGISWNELAIKLSNIVVDQVVNSTVNWMNSGFQGAPAFVTDPGAYFGGLANSVAGDFIQNSNVGFLCSPLQNIDLKLSLQTYYNQPYRSQCTLTQIGVNLQNFYNNFTSGGWGAFIQLTQSQSDNPYGAYINAQIELDRQVAAVVQSKGLELNWGQGFKSQGACVKYNGYPANGTAPASSDYNPNYAPGACIDYGPIQTPGSTIKAHLDSVLPANNFVSQIINADQFDKLLNALISGALKRFVFGGNGGLLGKASNNANGGGGGVNNAPPPVVTCSANVTSAVMNQTKVIWSASVSGAQVGDFVWSGPGLTNATGTSVSVVYTTPGSKTASVDASTSDVTTSFAPDGSLVQTYTNHQERVYTCNSNVVVSPYPPLVVTCIANKNRTNGWDLSNNRSDWVTWTATITGGSGKLDRLQWDGDQALVDGTDDTKVWPDGLASDSNDKYSPSLSGWNWSVTTPLNIVHAFSLFKGGPLNVNDTETVTHTVDANGLNTIQSVVMRPYFSPNTTNGVTTVNANISVIDSDPTVLPATNVQCGGGGVTVIKR